MGGCASGWSALPPELADLVLRRLSSHADRARFASVCHPWRHAAAHYSRPSLPPPLQWISFGDDGTSFQSLPDGELHSIRRSDELSPLIYRGWFGSWLLFKENPNNNGGGVSGDTVIWNLLTGATVRLPITSQSKYFAINKVIVCSGELVAATGGDYKGPDVVMCCRPGMASWSRDCSWFAHGYQDLAFYDGKIYTLTPRGALFVHKVTEDGDTGEPRVSLSHPVIQEPAPHWPTFCSTLNFDTRSYLVISCITNKLLLVQWIAPHDFPSSSRTVCRVFEADFGKRQWLEVENLGDQVLFVSSNCSRAIRASDHADHLHGNRVYNVYDKSNFSSPSRPTRICGVYDLSRKSILPVSFGEVHGHGRRITAAWFFP